MRKDVIADIPLFKVHYFILLIYEKPIYSLCWFVQKNIISQNNSKQQPENIKYLPSKRVRREPQKLKTLKYLIISILTN